MYYDDYEESYYDYDEANEEALDMACDMADRYGVSVSDAYQFAMESQKRTPEQRYAHRIARSDIAISAEDAKRKEYESKTDRYQRGLRDRSGHNRYSNYTKARSYVERPTDSQGRNELDRYRSDANRARFNAYMYPIQSSSAPFRKFAKS